MLVEEAKYFYGVMNDHMDCYNLGLGNLLQMARVLYIARLKESQTEFGSIHRTHTLL